jgi:hypothetical protein
MEKQPSSTLAFERRRRRRFAISMALQYRLNDGRHGNGSSVDISREGLKFSCGSALPSGELIEIDLDWPVLANGSDCVVLRLHGVVLRSDSGYCAASIAKHAFYVWRSAATPAFLSDEAGTAERVRSRLDLPGFRAIARVPPGSSASTTGQAEPPGPCLGRGIALGSASWRGAQWLSGTSCVAETREMEKSRRSGRAEDWLPEGVCK